MAPGSAARTLWRSERPFVIALAGGVVLRVLVMVAFPPGFVFSDGPYYLDLVDRLVPRTDRVSGYGFLLRALSWLSRDIWAISLLQHLLGLLVAVALYVLLRRRQVGPTVAMLATLPVLYDGMQLSLEHSVLTDVVFELLIVLAVVVLGWWPAPRVWTAGVGGLLLGLSVCVRIVGEPVVLAGVLFCLVAAVGLRAKVLTALVLVLGFAAPIAPYVVWYHQHHGVYALTESSGRALYMRTTSFVECSKLQVPSYEQKLCPREPVGQRQDPTYYGWHDPDPSHGLHPPPGVTVDDAFRDFAVRAIRAQPLDYGRVVVRDMLMTFYPARFDAYGYDTSHKWSFHYYVTYKPTEWNAPSYAAHGGQTLTRVQPLASALGYYGFVVITYGPLLLALVVLVVVGLVRRRPDAPRGLRSLAFLMTALGLGLAWVPDVTAEFVWRYQLPAVVLVPAGAALAWTRLRATPARGEPADDPADDSVTVPGGTVTHPASPQPGTRATPSTD